MGAATRALAALASLICICGAIALLFLLVLAGSRHRSPLDRIFFLQADTRGIPNAPNGITHWTLYNHCDSTHGGLNSHCGPNSAAYPFDPARNFNTHHNVPQDFINSPRKYYYLSRFLYAFYIIDLFFALAAAALGLWALVHHFSGYAPAVLSAMALLCTTSSACIMTACFTMGQNAFRRVGRFARIGVKATAFSWSAVALLGLATLGYLLSGLAGRQGRWRGAADDGERVGAGGRERRGLSRFGAVRRSRFENGESVRRLREDGAEERVRV